jgi:hypothetical protein
VQEGAHVGRHAVPAPSSLRQHMAIRLQGVNTAEVAVWVLCK